MASGMLGRLAGLAVLSIGIGGAVLAACQSQQFVPVEPRAVGVVNKTVIVLGKQLPANVMLVVDKSGSMTESVTGSGGSCTIDGRPGSDYDPRSPNPCKWNDLKTVLADPATGFLVQSQTLARFGLLAFPAATSTCDPGSVLVPIGGDVQPIRDQLLNRVFPGGGTPSATSILEAAKDPALAKPEANRQHFIMLLTDGLPNCNPANAAKCAACRANSASCNTPDGCRPTDSVNTCDPTPFDGAGCLDGAALVSAVKQVHDLGITTFVIGIGQATATSDAFTVLSQAALAGGHPRIGAAQSYYQANSVQELRSFLEEILQAFPCTFTLDPKPSDRALLSVSFIDLQGNRSTQLVQGTDWQLSDTGDAVELIGDRCNLVQNAPPDRYEVQIVYANPL